MRMFLARKRFGFTAIELLLVLGVLAITSGLSIPMYRQYLIRSDLEISRQNITQGLQRARFLSQVAMNDSAWGFATFGLPDRGILFMGDNFATRNPAYDEDYSIPDTIGVTGLTEVSFSKIEGRPSAMGTITLTALNGEQRNITVNIGETGTIDIPDDWIDICVSEQTIKAPESLWTYYQNHGALMGACGLPIPISSAPSSAPSSLQSSTPASAPSSALSSSGGDSGPEVVVDDDTVNPTEAFSCDLQVLGAAITYGGTYDMPVTLQIGIGGEWINPYGDWSKPVDANVNDGQQHTYICADPYDAEETIDVHAKTWKKKGGKDGTQNNHWTGWRQQSTETAHNQLVDVLVDGDPVPDIPAMANQASIQDFVEDYIDLGTGKIILQPNQVLYLFELGTTNPNSSAADFQDLVLLLTLTTP